MSNQNGKHLIEILLIHRGKPEHCPFRTMANDTENISSVGICGKALYCRKDKIKDQGALRWCAMGCYIFVCFHSIIFRHYSIGSTESILVGLDTCRFKALAKLLMQVLPCQIAEISNQQHSGVGRHANDDWGFGCIIYFERKKKCKQRRHIPLHNGTPSVEGHRTARFCSCSTKHY